MDITITCVSENIILLHFTEYITSISLRKFEEFTSKGEYINIKYNCKINTIPINVKNSNGNIFIEVTEINGKEISFGLFNN